MYYYKIIGENIVKFKITLGVEALVKLRSEIINKCSHIKHITNKVPDSLKPDIFDVSHIRNYKEKVIGRVDKGFYSNPEVEYFVEYDYYEHPILVKYIDDLLHGDTSSIEKIENMNIESSNEEKTFLEYQEQIIESLKDGTSNDRSKQIELLKQNNQKIIDYYNEHELNKNQISANEYKKKVLSCILMKKAAILPINSAIEVLNFFEESTSKTTESNLQKILKKEKI